MDFTMVIPVLIAFVLSVAAGPVVIPVLRRLKMDQTEREDGVKSHLKKAGTPTMGGVMILFAIAVTSLIYVREYPKVIPVLFVTIGFGLVGFLDDYLKVVLHRSDGLMPMQKMALQIVITAIFAFYIVKVAKIPLTMLIPFSGGKYLNIGWFAIPVLFIAVIGTVNGVNFPNQRFCNFRFNNSFYFDLRKKIYAVFSTAIKLFVSFLITISHNVTDHNTADIGSIQDCFQGFQFFRLDNDF